MVCGRLVLGLEQRILFLDLPTLNLSCGAVTERRKQRKDRAALGCPRQQLDRWKPLICMLKGPPFASLWFVAFCLRCRVQKSLFFSSPGRLVRLRSPVELRCRLAEAVLIGGGGGIGLVERR